MRNIFLEELKKGMKIIFFWIFSNKCLEFIVKVAYRPQLEICNSHDEIIIVISLKQSLPNAYA